MQDHTRSVTIFFDLPTSFRSQDEGDMLDYWAVRKAEEIEVATLYTIEQSPYLEWLSANSVAGLTGPQKHWLIAGLNQCVEVICDADDLPTIEVRILK